MAASGRAGVARSSCQNPRKDRVPSSTSRARAMIDPHAPASQPAFPRLDDRAPGDPGIAVAAAQLQQTEAVGRVVDESIESSARARRQREADDAERRAEEARLARLEEIERRERAEALAESEESRRAADEMIRRAEEDKARLEAARFSPSVTGPLDLRA